MISEMPLYGGGKLLGIHSEDSCLLDHCAIHNPSDHPLNAAPFSWFEEVRALNRVCGHGFHHPDPDDLRFKMFAGDWITVEAISSVHLMKENCDGCCQGTPEPYVIAPISQGSCSKDATA